MKMRDNLKKVMKEHKINQKTLALKVGLPISTLNGWLNGAAPKKIEDVKKVAEVFGLTIDELCFDQVEMKSSIYRNESVIAEFGAVELVLRQREK